MLVQRLRHGLLVGLLFATILSAWAIVQVLVTGQSPQHRLGLTLFQVVATYFGSGIVGGLVFGLLRPIADTGVGAAVLGLLVMLPVGFLITMVIAPEYAIMSKKFLLLWIPLSLMLGPPAGVMYWGQNQGKHRR